jgi:V8-like Glu-specific endopeptidase
MPIGYRAALVAWTCLAATACGSPGAFDAHASASDETRPTDTVSSAITQSEEDTDDDAIVAVMVREPDLQFVCTGTLISARVVVTAAHCLVGFQSAPLEVAFGHDVEAPSSRVRVTDRVIHPDYRAVPLADHDLAAVVLEQSALAEPVPLRRAPIENLDTGTSTRLVGFGLTALDGVMGQKHMGTARIDEIAATRFRVAPFPSLTCFHDSGAPALLSRGGVEQLAGVTTSGDADCAVFSRFMRVDRYVDSFLDPIVLAVDQGRPLPVLTAAGSPNPGGCQLAPGPGEQPRWLMAAWPAALGALARLRDRRRASRRFPRSSVS